MCIHNNEDGYDCLQCCFDLGLDDAFDQLPYNPPYKDIDQCNAYEEGYNRSGE